jgi:hypothetical protein
MPSGAPVSRSRLNGRRRSVSPPATLTASVHPAMTRLARTMTSASCSYLLRSSVRWLSLSVAAALWPGKARSNRVLASSIAEVDPSVPTAIDWTGSRPRRSADRGMAGHDVAAWVERMPGM